MSSSRVTFSILPSHSPSLALAPVAAVSGRTETAAASWVTVSTFSGRYRVRDRSSRLGGTFTHKNADTGRVQDYVGR